MREYMGLFRGKRVDNLEWAEGFYVREAGHFIKELPSAVSTPIHLVYPDTVGECTGKSVKTGKVFEGDIGRSIDGLFLVRWDEEKAAFVMDFYDYPYETLYLEEMWDDAEIIGNIHDNPELLKGGEENG